MRRISAPIVVAVVLVVGLAAFAPASARVDVTRGISLHLSGRLTAGGRIQVHPWSAACRRGVKVVIQRRTGGSWYSVGHTRSDNTGRFTVSLNDVAARYRAVVEASGLCLAAVSKHRTELFGAKQRRYVAGRSGVVGICVYNRRDQHTFCIDRRSRFYEASIVKVDIMGTVLRRAQEAHRALSSWERSKMRSMIEVSDNDAATALYDHVGGPSGLRPFNSRVGMQATYPSWHWGLTTTNPKDQVSLLQTFAYPNNTLSNKRRHHGLFLMRHVVSWQRWGVTAGVTTARRVAIKNGWLPLSEGWVVNSLGKVSGDGRNYVIAVLTRHGPSESYSIDTIQHLSAGVFRVLGY